MDGPLAWLYKYILKSLASLLPLQFSLIYNLDISGTYSGDVILRFVICATYMHSM